MVQYYCMLYNINIVIVSHSHSNIYIDLNQYSIILLYIIFLSYKLYYYDYYIILLCFKKENLTTRNRITVHVFCYDVHT